MPGTLFVVATPIGNLEDISARALRVLQKVSVIAAEDTRRTAKLLAHYGIRTPTTSFHAHNEQEKTQALLARLVRGEDVALVSDAGTPTVSDPGERLIAAAGRQGLRVEAIPGPSAVMTALATSGFPVVPFTFLGFPPAKGRARREWFESAAGTRHTLVFFEAPHRILRTLEDLRDVAGDIEVVVGRELTKAHEELVKGQISEVLQRGLREQGEFTVVAKIGRSTEKPCATSPNPTDMAAEFWQLTKNAGLSRRAAIGRLAGKYAMPSRAVYSMLELAKSSGNRPKQSVPEPEAP